jgi:hypothetical protein
MKFFKNRQLVNTQPNHQPNIIFLVTQVLRVYHHMEKPTRGFLKSFEEPYSFTAVVYALMNVKKYLTFLVQQRTNNEQVEHSFITTLDLIINEILRMSETILNMRIPEFVRRKSFILSIMELFIPQIQGESKVWELRLLNNNNVMPPHKVKKYVFGLDEIAQRMTEIFEVLKKLFNLGGELLDESGSSSSSSSSSSPPSSSSSSSSSSRDIGQQISQLIGVSF